MSAPTIRRARHGDLDAIAELERCAMVNPWSRRALAAELDRRDDGRVWVAVAGDPPRPVAYACVRLAAGEAELLRVAVAPEHRRRRLGAILLERVLARLRADGASVCHLEVGAANDAAIGLYRALGFREVGRRPAYYPAQGRERPEDALAMSRALG